MSSQDGEDTGTSVCAIQRNNAISSNENFEFVVVKDEPQDDVSGGEEDCLSIEITEGSVNYSYYAKRMSSIGLYRLYKDYLPS
jgi:hypothetical protein